MRNREKYSVVALNRCDFQFYLTFRNLDVRSVGEILRRAVGPWQRGFETSEQVEYAPGDYRVVIKGHIEGNHGGRYAQAAHVVGYKAPGSDGSFSQSLANSEFQVEDRNSHDGKHDEVWDEECT